MSDVSRPLNVKSEIGKLKKVLLHRPGKELENLMPEYLERLLFDDIPYLEIAQKEHDAFAQILRDNGVEVSYLENLASEAIVEDEIRKQLVEDYLDEGNIIGKGSREVIKNYFKELNNKDLVEKMMAGIRKTELADSKDKSLSDMIDSRYPFVVDPMPNLYFTRDPFATIGSGITLNRMKTETRNRETLFAKYIFKYHPRYRNINVPIWYDRKEGSPMEGGDELILSDKVIAIGISARTDAVSIEKFARKILYSDESFETILAFDIPKRRAFMHLDTVFTMVDYDKFTIHPAIEGPLTVFSLTKNKNGGDKLNIVKEEATLKEILKKYLELDNITLIRCAGGNLIDASREQWNDGSNTLAIAPGEVIVYSRNYVTNRVLRDHGIKVHEMPSSELSRGRGGPRCMSMPLIREDL
ncbi:arginine deiminase [Sporosalibacterium faouarense]|uniref:arginine deiminase n=1 Tax=Sporosalibacterium faouarense TaxID=516123 RepID=UPI00141C4FC8|nr:arginine deiminase [Sporosalibacterium faouarense]MTI49359.1 arginine deiminase [Bacillota bacterium]